MDLVESIKGRKQLPHRYSYFDVKHPMGKYAIKIQNKYYALKSGLWKYEQAKKLQEETKQLKSEIYELNQNELKICKEISFIQIPVEIFEWEICKYLNICELEKLRTVCKNFGVAVGRQISIQREQKRIDRNREGLNFKFISFTVVDDDGDVLKLLKLPLEVPRPKLAYGLPDIDHLGNPIPDHILSNDSWHMLRVMLAMTTPYKHYGVFRTLQYSSEEEFWDLIKNYTEDIFKNLLIGAGSDYLRPMIERHGDAFKLFKLVGERDLKLSKEIYSFCRREVDQLFVDSGLYSDVVDINAVTIHKFKTLPGYPSRYHEKIYEACKIKIFDPDNELTDEIFNHHNQYLSTLSYYEALGRQIFEYQEYGFEHMGLCEWKIIYKLALNENELQNYIKKLVTHLIECRDISPYNKLMWKLVDHLRDYAHRLHSDTKYQYILEFVKGNKDLSKFFKHITNFPSSVMNHE